MNCNTRRSKDGGKAFTLIELLVVIAIISLLVSILLPSLKRAQTLAKLVVCTSNMKNIGTVFVLYENEYDGWLPPTQCNDATSGLTDWSTYLATCASEFGDYNCPSSTIPSGEKKFNYGMNQYLGMSFDGGNTWMPNTAWFRLEDVRPSPEYFMLAGDASHYYGNYPQITRYERYIRNHAWYARFSHDHSGNFLMLDGHVDNLSGIDAIEASGTSDESKYLTEDWFIGRYWHP